MPHACDFVSQGITSAPAEEQRPAKKAKGSDSEVAEAASTGADNDEPLASEVRILPKHPLNMIIVENLVWLLPSLYRGVTNTVMYKLKYMTYPTELHC